MVPMFQNKDLSVATESREQCILYRAVVLAMYGTETWTMKFVHRKCLNLFHSRCIRTILDVTMY